MTASEHRNEIVADIDNALSRQRILRVIFRQVEIPQATYDYKGSTNECEHGLVKVNLRFFLPKTRKIRRCSGVIGGELQLLVHVWALPDHPCNRPTVLKHRSITIDGLDTIRIHLAVPLRKDTAGVIW